MTLLTHPHTLRSILSVALLGLMPALLAAQAPAAKPHPVEQALAKAPTEPPPKGLRIFTLAHSFHAFVPPILGEIAKTAGISGHTQLGLSSIGGSQVIQHWNVPDEKNLAKQLLEKGEVDALTIAPIWMPDDGLDKFGELAFQHNPNIRIFVQEFWMPNDTYNPVYPLESNKRINHDAVNFDDLKAAQTKYDHDLTEYLKGLNAKLGKQVFFVVPVGPAVIGLREAIAKGEVRGMYTQNALFFDGWGHPEQAIQTLAAYCNYACIYGRNPLGLHKNLTETGEDPHLVQLIQKLAVDAVTQNPMSGVTALAKTPPASPAATLAPQ